MPFELPSRVIVGTVITGRAASRLSSSSNSGWPCARLETPAVVVDDDVAVVGVVEGRRAALEGRFVAVPLRRVRRPQDPGDVVPVRHEAGTSALGGEVVLIPPVVLGPGGQRHPVGGEAGDDVAAHREQPEAALRPERGEDAGGAGAPVVADHHRALDPERIEQAELVVRHDRLLRVARRREVDEAGRAMAAQMRHDHATAARGEQQRHVGVAVDVVRVAVHQQHRNPVGRPGLVVADAQLADADLPDRLEPRQGTR